MNRFGVVRSLSVLGALLLVVGAAAIGAPSAAAAPPDQWIEVQPVCCGDGQAFVFLAGNWPAGVLATLEIDRVSTGPGMDESVSQLTPQNFFVQPPLAVGDLVRVTVDGIVRETTVVPLRAETANPFTDVATGTAAPGATVAVRAGEGPTTVEILTTAGPDGGWTADFSGIFDLQEAVPPNIDAAVSGVSARVVEADGDAVASQTFATVAFVTVMPAWNGQVMVQNPSAGWRAGSVLTVEIDRGDDGTAEFQKVVTVGGAPDLVGPSDGVAPLTIGDRVTVNGGAWTKSVVVVPLSVTSVDPATDQVSGTAEPGAIVTLDISTPNVPGPPSASTVATADPSGTWTTDMSPFHDLLPTEQVNASVADGDRDRVVDLWVPSVPALWLTPEPAEDLTDGQQISLTGSGWPAGSTVNVSQCRLDQPLSPEACDPSTTQTSTIDPAGNISMGFTVHRSIQTGAATYDCAGGCGLVGVVWSGVPGQSNLLALDFPENNPISFRTAPTEPSQIIPLVEALGLRPSVQKRLVVALRSAQASFDRGKSTPGCRTMSTFVVEVRTSSPRWIASGDAADLIAAARAVQSAYSC